MMQKPTSRADGTTLNVVIVTLDSHLASACERAQLALRADLPGLKLSLHAASEFTASPANLARCLEDIASGHIIIVTMLFMEEHISAVLPALQQRRADCDAMIACMAAPEVVRLTKMGRLNMGEKPSAALSFLKKLRGKPDSGQPTQATGERQMKMLRRLPKLLRFIPGTAQDLRAYFLTLQYWLAGSDDNTANMIRLLAGRYAAGDRQVLRAGLTAPPPVEYPETGLYHPRLKTRISERLSDMPRMSKARGRVGVLVMRAYVLAGNTAHYDGVIAALEAEGLDVVPAFASGLDARPAIDHYFMDKGSSTVDAVLSLTGFSLVGGPAYNDARGAEEALSRLDVPYVAGIPVEFQTLESWSGSERGLMPVESTMMVAIPELDGATGSMIFGGRSDQAPSEQRRDMQAHEERTRQLARRVAKLVANRRTERKNRRIGIVLFNFPPNSGAVGSAAFLSVFESLFNTMKGLAAAGYAVELPESVAALQDRILKGNAESFGAAANVHHRIPTEDHIRREEWLNEIEAQWGPAPGRQQADGASLHVLGARFGNVFIGVQPAFGYEGDPMRLLFEKGFAPTHAFSAFYRYLREDFGAHAVLHFGTHGALEFMPGKQVGLAATCWPDRLIGDLPNVYLYAANNPSEGTLAKRRAAATTVSYLTPPIAQAGLYRGLLDLKASLDRWRKTEPEEQEERAQLAALIQVQAAGLDLAASEPAWGPDAQAHVFTLTARVLELEYALIPKGLHVVGQSPSFEERRDLLAAMAEAMGDGTASGDLITAIAEGKTPESLLPTAVANDNLLGVLTDLAKANRLLLRDTEVDGLIHALDGGYVRPAPGGDIIRNPDVLPTGRNIHGFDPFRMPSTFAMVDGSAQAERLLARHVESTATRTLPETVALVLWGTDNLKTEGAPIAQALALIGAKPRFDAYGRLAGANLIPLDQLGRPRIDVVMTLSGIFRDLLPLQVRLLAEACWLAASADEPETDNFIRKHALAHMRETGCDLETAALRVFSNADGTYGANVNHLIDSGRWDQDDEIAETYTSRKSFAYDRKGATTRQADLLKSVLAGVELAHQNLESVEVGVTTVDQYFDTLGGISRAITRANGGHQIPVYISDQTRGQGQVRTLDEQVALETRSRMLNPKWYEGLLKHGYEGVRHIEAHVTNTLGWSATTGQVAPWVYQQITELYVLDPAMRERLAKLNATASVRLANRLIEAKDRNYWNPDPETLAALQAASEELEDILEGVSPGRAA